jgi:hypothetical protein
MSIPRPLDPSKPLRTEKPTPRLAKPPCRHMRAAPDPSRPEALKIRKSRGNALIAKAERGYHPAGAKGVPTMKAMPPEHGCGGPRTERMGEKLQRPIVRMRIADESELKACCFCRSANHDRNLCAALRLGCRNSHLRRKRCS